MTCSVRKRQSPDAGAEARLADAVAMLGAAHMHARACPPVATRVSISRRVSRGASTRASRVVASSVTTSERDVAYKNDVQLACPICLRPFKRGLSCASCGRSFPIDGGVLDLCLDAGGASGAYKEPPAKSGTRLFQSELISSVYENGWRQSFAWAGFPGEEEETRYAMEYMLSNGFGAEGSDSILLDVSCGSGLFSRRFASSGRFGKVIASDFSKTMMTQTRNYCVEDLQLKKQTEGPNASLLFVRADVGRLPFASGSLDCVHAGAAMHCWPSPSVAVAEISRVLKPGGVFVASTFLDPTAVLGEFVGGDETVSSLSALFKDSGVGTGGAFNQFFSEPELRDLTTSVCGFERFQRKRNRQFVLFSVAKPKQSTESD